MKTVLVFGTFDLLHRGHEYFLYRARQHGERLVVVIGTDRNVAKFKKRRPVESESERAARVRALSYVDQVVIGREDHDYGKLIAKIRPQIICLGYDQHSFDLEEKIQGKGISVIRLEPYKKGEFKSSLIRKRMMHIK